MNSEDLQIRKNYDNLIHLLEEAKLPRKEVVGKAKELFPEFSDISLYDDVIDGYAVEKYRDARSKGLTVEEAAHTSEVSYHVISQALIGGGVSLESFLELAKAELFSKSQKINDLLNVIERAESSTDVNAAVMLLEKIAPERYGKAVGTSIAGKTTDDKSVTINFSVADE